MLRAVPVLGSLPGLGVGGEGTVEGWRGSLRMTREVGRVLQPQRLQTLAWREAIYYANMNVSFLFLAQDFGDVVYTFEIPFHGKTFILKVRTFLDRFLSLCEARLLCSEPRLSFHALSWPWQDRSGCKALSLCLRQMNCAARSRESLQESPLAGRQTPQQICWAPVSAGRSGSR